MREPLVENFRYSLTGYSKKEYYWPGMFDDVLVKRTICQPADGGGIPVTEYYYLEYYGNECPVMTKTISLIGDSGFEKIVAAIEDKKTVIDIGDDFSNSDGTLIDIAGIFVDAFSYYYGYSRKSLYVVDAIAKVKALFEGTKFSDLVEKGGDIIGLFYWYLYFRVDQEFKD